MANVAALLKDKDSRVATVAPDASVLEAAQIMNERHIGSLVVVEGGKSKRGPVAGIITERDILTRIVAVSRDPRTTRIREVMTTPVITCDPRATLDELRAVMRSRRIRHVPVIDAGQLAGIVSIGDLNAAEAQVMSETIGYLEQYVYMG